MDRIQQLNYEKDFTIAFLKSKGDAFQGFFEKLMSKAHPNDFMACRPWGNMAVLCADWKTMDLCASALAQRKLPHRVRKKSGEYRPGTDAI